jgi:tryptophan synthase alpha chain
MPTMNRIDGIFQANREKGKAAIMPFVCGGHPAPGSTAAVLPALQSAGASIVEVGFPFSDPIADGPVIAAAMHDAIEAGVTPSGLFDEIASVRDQVTLGLVAMVSVSIVFRLGGPNAFVERAAAAGFDGFIFPDAPLEDSTHLLAAAAEAGCTASLLVAPTTPPERIEAIVKASTGFVYLLARSGITGERDDAPVVGPAVARIRAMTDLPIACGFGISTPEHVAAVTSRGETNQTGGAEGKGGGADAAIVGSALVRRMGEAADPIEEAGRFVAHLATGLA